MLSKIREAEEDFNGYLAQWLNFKNEEREVHCI